VDLAQPHSTQYSEVARMPGKAIEVESVGGDVTLRGEVSSFYQRQLCINCCRRVAGVIRLIDEIQVVPNG